MSKAKPNLTFLSPAQIEEIHQNSLTLLAKTGIRVDSEKAQNIFLNAGCKKIDAARISIPAEIVESAIPSAPPTIDVYNRRGDQAFSIGKGAQCRFGIGVTNLWYEEPESRKIIPFLREHVSKACRLGEKLTNYDLISTPGIIQDLPAEISEQYAALEMVANTEKPLVLLVAGATDFRNVLELLQHLHGNLADLPFLLPYFNPVTPLVLNDETSDKIFTSIEFGLPIIYSNYGMAGATTPITGAGTLVTLNAELLAGLVFTQLIKEGTPVILGSLPALFEMKNMISAYTPQTMLLNLACAEMMAFYRIPHAGTSGSGSGWGADLLASGTLWMNHLTSILGKTGLAPFVGGNFDSLVFSPETVVYADEIIRQVRLFEAGFDLDETNFALEQIDLIGPGGNFLVSEATLNLFQKMNEQHSAIWPGHTLENWQAGGTPQAADILQKHTLDIIAEMKPPADHDELIAKGEDFIKQ